MKKTLITVFAMSLGSLFCLAEEKTAVPEEKTAVQDQPAAQEAPKLDLANAFPEEEVVSKMNMERVQVYTYMMNHQFVDLQKKLEAFLGKPWTKSGDKDSLAEAMKGAQEEVEAAGMKILGFAIYEDVKNPLSSVILMQMSIPAGAGLDDSKTMVTLTYSSR